MERDTFIPAGIILGQCQLLHPRLYQFPTTHLAQMVLQGTEDDGYSRAFFWRSGLSSACCGWVMSMSMRCVPGVMVVVERIIPF